MNQLFPFWSARAVGLDMSWESVVRRGLPNMFMLISGALIVPELVHFLMRFDDEGRITRLDEYLDGASLAAALG